MLVPHLKKSHISFNDISNFVLDKNSGIIDCSDVYDKIKYG